MTDDREPPTAPQQEPDPLLEELRRIASIVEPPPATSCSVRRSRSDVAMGATRMSESTYTR